MGDRCWVQVMVHKAHHDKFMEVTEGYFQHEYKEQKTEGDAIVIQDGQVNYGGYDQLQNAAEAGLTFSVISGAGGDHIPRISEAHGRPGRRLGHVRGRHALQGDREGRA